MDLPKGNAADIIIRISAVIGALGAIWGFIMIAAKLAKKTGSGFRAVLQMPSQIRRIAQELAPNGGGTIKDQLNRIEYRQCLGEQRSKAMSMDAPEAMFESDANGGTIVVNRTYANMVGMDINGLKGSGWLTGVHHEDRERAFQEWNAAVTDKREFDCLFRMVNVQTAMVFSVRVRAYPLQDPSGKVAGFLGVITPHAHAALGAHLDPRP